MDSIGKSDGGDGILTIIEGEGLEMMMMMMVVELRILIWWKVGNHCG
jgi:hypothetical protein